MERRHAFSAQAVQYIRDSDVVSTYSSSRSLRETKLVRFYSNIIWAFCFFPSPKRHFVLALFFSAYVLHTLVHVGVGALPRALYSTVVS